MPKVTNPGPSSHRVRGVWFPVGEPTPCDEATAKWVVENMGFKVAPVPIAEGAPVVKPTLNGKKK